MTLHIRSIQDAEDFLVRCLDEPDYGGDGPVVFDACFSLCIRLDPGDGKTNRRIDRARSLLQRHVDLTYLQATARPMGRLTPTERERLSIIGTTREGSTNLVEQLANAFDYLRSKLPDHWSHRRRNLVVVGALLATAGAYFAPSTIQYAGAVHGARIGADATIRAAQTSRDGAVDVARIQADAQITAARIQAGLDTSASQVSLFDKKRPAPSRAEEALAALAHDDPSRVVWFATSDYVPWRYAMLDLAPLAGTISWNDSKPIPAAVAKAVAKQGKKESARLRRDARERGQPGIVATPWVTDVFRTHSAPAAMRLGATDA